MSEVTDDMRQEARQLGWADKEHWKGNPEHWVDADQFLERGRTVLPIVRENNERLQQTVSKQEQRISELQKQLEEGRSSMEEFKKFHADELKRKVAETKRELLVGIEEARKEGNTEAVVDLQEKLDELNESSKGLSAPPAKEPEKKPPPAEPQLDPALQTWMGQNPWFGTDPVKSNLAIGIAQKLKSENPGLLGADFYAKVSQELEAYLAPARGASKMEGGGGNGAGNNSGGEAKGFAGLPPEAQAYAKAEARKYVGPNKMFKTEKDWLEYYAEHF